MGSADSRAIRISRVSFFSIALGLSVFLSCIPKQKFSQKRIVFFKLENAKKTKIRKKLAKELKSNFVVVPNQEFKRTAKKLNIKNLDKPDDIAKVSKKLNIDVVIWGVADKRKTSTKINLNIVDGKNGLLIDHFKTKIKTKEISPKKTKSIAKGLVLKLETFFAKQKSKPRSCLLYTSPSPRDATLSRMPSSA